jgi:MtN3 and saliva related transmembrane protein
MLDLLGWASSIVLLLTIGTQILKQWRERSARGVSGWLFIGQTVASTGFTLYSALIGNWVFTATNALLLISAVVGWVVTKRFKREARRAPQFSGAEAA